MADRSALSCPRCGNLSLLSGYCAACHFSSSTSREDFDWEDCDCGDTDSSHYAYYLFARRLARVVYQSRCAACDNLHQGGMIGPCDVCLPARDAIRDIPHDWLFSPACLPFQGKPGRWAVPCSGCVERDCCCGCHER